MEQTIQPPDQQLLNSTSSETSQNSAHARKSRISLFSEYNQLYAPFSSNLNVEERQKTINLNIVSGFGRIESNKIAEVEYSILQSKKFQNMDQSADQKEQGLKDLEKLQEWDDKREIHEAKYKGILRDIDGIFSQSGKTNTGFAQIADKISFGMGTFQKPKEKVSTLINTRNKQIDDSDLSNKLKLVKHRIDNVSNWIPAAERARKEQQMFRINPEGTNDSNNSDHKTVKIKSKEQKISEEIEELRKRIGIAQKTRRQRAKEAGLDPNKLRIHQLIGSPDSELQDINNSKNEQLLMQLAEDNYQEIRKIQKQEIRRIRTAETTNRSINNSFGNEFTTERSGFGGYDVLTNRTRLESNRLIQTPPSNMSSNYLSPKLTSTSQYKDYYLQTPNSADNLYQTKVFKLTQQESPPTLSNQYQLPHLQSNRGIVNSPIQTPLAKMTSFEYPRNETDDDATTDREEKTHIRREIPQIPYLPLLLVNNTIKKNKRKGELSKKQRDRLLTPLKYLVNDQTIQDNNYHLNEVRYRHWLEKEELLTMRDNNFDIQTKRDQERPQTRATFIFTSRQRSRFIKWKILVQSTITLYAIMEGMLENRAKSALNNQAQKNKQEIERKRKEEQQKIRRKEMRKGFEVIARAGGRYVLMYRSKKREEYSNSIYNALVSVLTIQRLCKNFLDCLHARQEAMIIMFKQEEQNIIFDKPKRIVSSYKYPVSNLKYQKISEVSSSSTKLQKSNSSKLLKSSSFVQRRSSKSQMSQNWQDSSDIGNMDIDQWDIKQMINKRKNMLKQVEDSENIIFHFENYIEKLLDLNQFQTLSRGINRQQSQSRTQLMTLKKDGSQSMGSRSNLFEQQNYQQQQQKKKSPQIRPGMLVSDQIRKIQRTDSVILNESMSQEQQKLIINMLGGNRKVKPVKLTSQEEEEAKMQEDLVSEEIRSVAIRNEIEICRHIHVDSFAISRFQKFMSCLSDEERKQINDVEASEVNAEKQSQKLEREKLYNIQKGRKQKELNKKNTKSINVPIFPFFLMAKESIKEMVIQCMQQTLTDASQMKKRR